MKGREGERGEWRKGRRKLGRVEEKEREKEIWGPIGNNMAAHIEPLVYQGSKTQAGFPFHHTLDPGE